jgi:hypothetical protein
MNNTFLMLTFAFANGAVIAAARANPHSWIPSVLGGVVMAGAWMAASALGKRAS